MAANKLMNFGTKLLGFSTRMALKTAQTGQRVAVWSQPHLLWFMNHGRKELLPPNPSEWPVIKKGLADGWQTFVRVKFTSKPMKEVLYHGLVGAEIAGWFFVGEIIGRKSLIGYKV